MRLLLALLFSLTVPTSALAEEGTLSYGKDKGMMPVWRSQFAMEQGMVLLQAKEEALAIRYMTCFVPSGTRVVAMYVGEHVYRVVVREGKDRGCEGYVSSDFFHLKQTP